MPTTHTPDHHVPVRRLQFDRESGALAAAPREELFLRGPIPLAWLRKAAALPGKTLNVAIALWWRHGMTKGKPFKLTQTALTSLNVKRDAASAGLARLEQEGLIRVERKAGQRPTITILQYACKSHAVVAEATGARLQAGLQDTGSHSTNHIGAL